MPFLKASHPHKEAVSPEGDISVVTQEGKDRHTIEEEMGRGGPAGGGARASPVGPSRPSASSNGLGHHGEPAGLEEGRERESLVRRKLKWRRRPRRGRQPDS